MPLKLYILPGSTPKTSPVSEPTTIVPTPTPVVPTNDLYSSGGSTTVPKPEPPLPQLPPEELPPILEEPVYDTDVYKDEPSATPPEDIPPDDARSIIDVNDVIPGTGNTETEDKGNAVAEDNGIIEPLLVPKPPPKEMSQTTKILIGSLVVASLIFLAKR